MHGWPRSTGIEPAVTRGRGLPIFEIRERRSGYGRWLTI
jgi:hypothetical protein